MGFWHRAKVMLGLADDYDEEYEDYDRRGGYDDYDEEPASDAQRGYESPYGGGPAPNSVRRVDRPADLPRARAAAGEWDRTRESDRQRSANPAWGQPEPAAAPQVKMHITEPRSFSEAQTIADKLKSGTPVIMNLSQTDADLSKRLIDFASGLTYGLDGGLQKVADRVFMLTPANVAVSAEDRRRLRDKGLFSLDA